MQERDNSLAKLVIDGVLVEDKDQSEVHADETLYKKTHKWCPRLNGLDLASISSGDSDMLEGWITEIKVLQAIKTLGEDKAPGSDGFPLLFFKKFWDFIEGDHIKLIDEF